MEIRGSTIVITGASSGNGKALALALAKEGANLVLAARREHLLNDLARECEELGVRALAVKTDITKDDELRHLYNRALLFSDSIDVWVNNAGVLAMGEFSKTPWGLCHQLVMTNLIGSMHAAHLIVPHFIKNNKGMLIHMNSLSAFIPTPHVAAYSASKVGLKGFSEALRYELTPYKDIHVCDVFATFMDTTGLDHAANFTEHKLAPPPPVYDPCDTAAAIVKLIQHPKPSIYLGANSYIGRVAHALAPETLGHVMDKLTRFALKRSPHEPKTEGNIMEPVEKGTGVHGGWRKLGLFRKHPEASNEDTKNLH